jgi:hypothetical protein
MQIKRNEIVNIVTEAIDKSEILDYVKKDKNFEKRVKEIASEVVTELFRVLWQHNALFKNLGK